MSSLTPKKDKRATLSWNSIKNDLIAYAFMAPYLFLFVRFSAAAGGRRRLRQLHQMGHHRRTQMARVKELYQAIQQRTLHRVAAEYALFRGFGGYSPDRAGLFAGAAGESEAEGTEYRARHRLPAPCRQRGGGGHHLPVDPGAQLGIVELLSGRYWASIRRSTGWATRIRRCRPSPSPPSGGRSTAI